MSKKSDVFGRMWTELTGGPTELRSLGLPDAAAELEAKIEKAAASYQRLVGRMGQAEAEAFMNRKLMERGWGKRV